MKRERRFAPGWISGLAGAAVILALVRPEPAAGAAEATARRECDLGIALALSGEPARAESVFVSLLSHHPGDAGAFTNLGNLHLLGGDPEMALGFYRRAGEADSSDAGIVLDEATALLLLGEEREAEERARLGIRLAGDPAGAASLLGLRYRPAPATARGAPKAQLHPEEVLEMLRAATGRVPADSTRAGGRSGAAARKHAPQWRAAGPRAGDAAAPPTLLYWKR